MKTQVKFLVSALLLAASGLAVAGDHCPYKGKTRYMKSQDWQAMCQCTKEKTSCIAGTRVLGWVSSIYGTAHVLRVKSSAEGSLLSWKPRLYVPDERNPISLKVDNLQTVMLMAGKGYSLDEGVVQLGNAALAANLLPSLKRGSQLKLSYTDQFGDRRSTVFSLAGMTRAMNFVGARIQKKAAAGPAKSAPKATPAKPVAKPTPRKAAAKPAATATTAPKAPAQRQKFE